VCFPRRFEEVKKDAVHHVVGDACVNATKVHLTNNETGYSKLLNHSWICLVIFVISSTVSAKMIVI
jgi:hypothetical protein